jgi:hypothetical protein
MFSTLRTRFGIPGVISVIALVFAMFGGAYAASNSSGGGKATASAKAKKGPRGPKGATGPVGPAGAQGPAGPAGAKGDAGANGAAGGVGPAGPTGAKGATGATGPAGLSGFTKTLPKGETETGTWAIEAHTVVGSYVPTTSISFPIPLEQAGGPASAFGFTKAETAEIEAEEIEPGGCKGSVAKPTAPAGKLCVYTGYEVVEGPAIGLRLLRSTANQEGVYSASGAILQGGFVENATTENTAIIEAYGSWAVTAP